MSRIITEIARNRFLSGETFRQKNTVVCRDVVNGEENTCLYLFGNRIARIDKSGILYICNCGYFTATTKERLNSLPGVSISQKKYVWFLNGEKWDGTETKIAKVR
ncbi:MAG: hypothetical protein NC124_02500 [Clostridium sp.]|nr:hypothetical protein [Clostridium sp.]